MISTKIKPSQGKILISEPFLQDNYFKRAVILLIDHNDKGSMGLILNKPINLNFNNVIRDFPFYEGKIYYGGPVDNDSLFYIHKLGEEIENSIHIVNDIYFSGDLNQIKDLMEKGKLNPNNIMFFIGYSGWTSGQLEDELSIDSWLVANYTNEYFNTNEDKSAWKTALKTLGGEFAIMANYPEDPSLN